MRGNSAPERSREKGHPDEGLEGDLPPGDATGLIPARGRAADGGVRCVVQSYAVEPGCR